MRAKKSHSFIRIVFDRYRRSVSGMFALVMVAAFILLAVFAPIIANDRPIFLAADGKLYVPALIKHRDLSGVNDIRTYVKEHSGFAIFPPLSISPYTTDLSMRLMPPSLNHPLGTDELGRDVFARMIHGMTVSLSVGIVATFLSIVLGVFFGALAGYFGGWVDAVISRMIEVIICFPRFFIFLAIIAMFKPDIILVMLVIGFFDWPGIARLVRGEVLAIKKMEYVEAARVIGAGDASIILRHILPNAITPVLVTLAFGIAGAILAEASLSFLGMGVQPPLASWGQIMEKAQNDLSNWWLFTFPGMAIFYTTIAFTMMGEALRNALDVKSDL
ncbi:MAG: ABC transporter permease [Spirochaetota bacterium]